MTIEWIIQMLKTSGIGSKQIVLNALEKATKDDLLELIRSIHTVISIEAAKGSAR